MATKWTKEQRKVIDTRNRNLLVSAAAGSGKTAVLVERIIARITDREHPVDIDRLLVMTFTKAAAAEMRERIAAAIDTMREQFPEDERLERQQALIHNAQITTIDSFCLFVVRNHFEEISLDPNFRIADTGEIRLLEMDVLAEVFEEHYAAEDNDAFLQLVDAYSGSKNDAAVKEMVSQIYHLSGSNPWQEEWIAGLTEIYQVESEEELEQTEVVQEVTRMARVRLMEARENLAALKELALAADGPQKYAVTLDKDLEQLAAVEKIRAYRQMYAFLQGLQMGSIAQIRKFEGDGWKKEYVKNSRNDIKKDIGDIKDKFFSSDLTQLLAQLKRIAPMAQQLVELSLDYLHAMEKKKRQNRIVDFGDIEHFALKIFVDEKTKELRPAAKEFQQHFEEIMVDEYQDSNQVQESIMQAISREHTGGHNLFMVGDVKQSIYRFRLARAELFMEKYASFTADSGTDMRIDLHKNFRSRREVLDFSNDIFYKIMQADLGNVAYDKEAALYCGAAYEETPQMEAEVLIYDAAEDDGETGFAEDNARRLEARMVAQRIHDLMEHGRVTDKATGKLRPVRYRDIVILLRSLKGWDADFSEILEGYGIPVHVESTTGYFSAPEVQTLLSFLKILDNPYQDIPMAAVLKSPIAGLDEEELAELRISNREMPFAAAAYEAMEQAQEGKLYRFYMMYRELRAQVCDTPVHELILQILRRTGYGNYVAAMPAGKKRAANLDMLVEKAIAYEKTSYKGLFHFVRYIEELRKYDVDFGEADVTGENEDVVHIMTIHKSKGLEFPAVFVSGIAKQFNQMDANQKLVLHADLGMGISEVTPSPRIRRNCLVRSAIADRVRRENLGEELRVLYVALTRAKEKLILTGSAKDWAKTMVKYTGNVLENMPLSFTQRVKASCYMDWVVPAMESYPGKYEVQTFGAADLVLSEVKRQVTAELDFRQTMEEIRRTDPAQMQKLQELLAYEYPYLGDANKKSKYSVSEIKHNSMLQEYDAAQLMAELPDFLKEEKEPFVPEFARKMQAAQEIAKKGPELSGDPHENVQSQPGIPGVSQGALRGTAVHRVMECMDFAAIAELEQTDDEAVGIFVRKQLAKMLDCGEITKEMCRLVPAAMIESFVRDDVALRMAKAQLRGDLFREKPFVMEHEGVLIQGIVDVFWIEGDKLVLLDYKTDRVKRQEELVCRYKTQLELYADALTRVFSSESKKMKAEECLMYSFRLKEVIRV